MALNSTNAIVASADSNTRTISSILIQTSTTHVFAVTAYWGLNILVDRSYWQNQNISTIPMFALYPWMMACHLIVNIVCILRNIAFSAVGPGEHNAFAYYLSGLLGVHSFHEDRGKDKALVGLKRVIDDKRARFRTERREWDSQLTFQFVSLLFPFTQGFFATWLYFRRKKLSPTGSGVYLGFDHRNGWMAIGGTLASLAAIARLILGYDWVKKENTQWWEMRIDASAQVDSLDTSNAFVYEGLLAFMVQIILLSANRRFPPTFQYRPVDRVHDAAFWASSLVPLCTFISMPLLFASNIRSVKARLRHNDYLNWVLVERTGRIVRWLLLLALCSGAGMQLYSDVIELRDLANGTVHDWNRYWALEDVWRVPTLK